MVNNANDLLGIIVNNCNDNGDISSADLLRISETDAITVGYLLKELSDKRYIVYSLDTQHLTDYGRSNYVSPKSVRSRKTKSVIKEVVSFFKWLIALIAGFLSAFFLL